MKRFPIGMLAGVTVLLLAPATPANAQAKGEATSPETDPGANQSIQGQRGIKVEWTPFETFDDSRAATDGVIQELKAMPVQPKLLPEGR